jgi:hypothetical protein
MRAQFLNAISMVISCFVVPGERFWNFDREKVE